MQLTIRKAVQSEMRATSTGNLLKLVSSTFVARSASRADLKIESHLEAHRDSQNKLFYNHVVPYHLSDTTLAEFRFRDDTRFRQVENGDGDGSTAFMLDIDLIDKDSGERCTHTVTVWQNINGALRLQVGNEEITLFKTEDNYESPTGPVKRIYRCSSNYKDADRPRYAEINRTTKRISLRVGSCLLADIDACAESEGINRNTWLFHVIRTALDAPHFWVRDRKRGEPAVKMLRLRLDPALLQRLDGVVNQSGLSRTDWVRQAVEDALERSLLKRVEADDERNVRPLSNVS